MKKINIKNVNEARQFVGRRVRLFWFDGREYLSRGEGLLRLGSGYGADFVVGVGTGSSSDCGMPGSDAVAAFTSDDAWIELLDAHPDAARYAAMVGKRIKVVAAGGSDDYARFSARLAGGIVTAVDTTGLAQTVSVTWLTDSGDSYMCYIGPDFWPDVVIDEPPTLADQLKTARAEVARIEAEIAREQAEAAEQHSKPSTLADQVKAAIAHLDAAATAREQESAEQKAREERETEDARFPLPHGWHWEMGIRGILSWPAAVGPAPAPNDGSTICVHVWECSDSRYPPRVVSRVYKDGAVTCEYRSAPLDVVRAVIARYDAEHGATDAKQEPYSIDIPAGRWASEVSHSFQDGDVIDLTFASGRVQRVTCYVYRDNGLLIDDGYRRDDGNGYSFVVGNVDGRGVTKVTLVSRGAQ